MPPFAVYYIGQGEARRQEVFYILDDARYVVLRTYGDNILAARFDPKTRTIKRQYAVIKISAGKPVHLSETKLGRLKLEKRKRTETK